MQALQNAILNLDAAHNSENRMKNTHNGIKIHIIEYDIYNILIQIHSTIYNAIYI